MQETSNQANFDSQLAEKCRKDPESGVCMGPEWTMVMYKDVALGGGAPQSDEEVVFETTSQPPTALVGVDPYDDSHRSNDDAQLDPGNDVLIPSTSKAQPDRPTYAGAHYRVRIDRVDPFHASSSCTSYAPNCGKIES